VVGGGLHDVQDLVTFPTADGNAGVAWLEPGVDRLRAALPGAPARADTLAPALQVLGSADSVVKNGDPLVLRVRCSAACDVRGQVHGADGQLSLDRAGRGRLRIQPRSLAIGSSRRRLVTVRLLYGAPGALHPQARTLRVRVRVTGVPRIHHIRSVRATRVTGDRIRVRWTTDVGGSESAFVVTGSATRGGQPLAVNLGEGRRRRFSLTLRHVRGIRFVAVSGLDPRDLGHPREVRVR
jgi:hypothetical protein